ncbi:MAG TPA: BamA/TamA family outer membrane protein [Steroidobacteraceae bacterium]
MTVIVTPARLVPLALSLACGSVAALLATPSWPDAAADTTAQPIPVEPGTTVPAPGPNVPRWLNPATAPFLPIPLVGADPNSGLTLGILPVRLETGDDHDIRRILAPDLYYNPNFGYGAHMRIYDYPSEDEQWSVTGGAAERVERGFDAEYQSGRLRAQRWSINGSVIFDRSGTPRFFGVGNEAPMSAETNYTEQETLGQAQIGFNLNRTWQLRYIARAELVDVLPGTLKHVASLEQHFPGILGAGTNGQLLNRLAIAYDTRDNLTAPTRGMEWVLYGGLASQRGVFNDSMYSETGVDGRVFWPIRVDTVLAMHVALRYMPTAHSLPFWALSSIGGDQSEIGGDQPLRGYGTGRYYDRDSFSTTLEVRHRVLSFNAISTYVDLELAPFVDLGRVFSQTNTFPLGQLHPVAGLGIRGIARPFVVGYVDIGYGNEGVAIFTGIDYPF